MLADVAATRLQDFLILLKDSFACSGNNEANVVPGILPVQTDGASFLDYRRDNLSFSLMNIFIVIVPVPLFILGRVISFISLKLISMLFFFFYSALVSGRISESKNSLILLLTVFFATNGSCPSILAFLTMFCISSISSGLSTLWLYLLAEK